MDCWPKATPCQIGIKEKRNGTRGAVRKPVPKQTQDYRGLTISSLKNRWVQQPDLVSR